MAQSRFFKLKGCRLNAALLLDRIPEPAGIDVMTPLATVGLNDVAVDSVGGDLPEPQLADRGLFNRLCHIPHCTLNAIGMKGWSKG